MTTTLDKVRKTALLPNDAAGVPVKRPVSRYGYMKQDVRQSVWSFRSFKWVLIAFALACVYYLFLASDKYVTVAQVYVKSVNEGSATNPQAALLGLAGPQQQDGLLAQEYITSSDMLQLIDAKLDLRSHFSSDEWDFYSRMSANASDEEFLKYYEEQVKVGFSPDSSILTISTQAFDANLSYEVTQEIISQTEKFINEVSQGIAAQETRFVRGEVERAKDELAAAQEKFANFQRDNQLLNAQASGEALQLVVNELEAEISRARAEEKGYQSYLNDDAPALVALRARIQGLEEQLLQEKAKISTGGGQAINDKSLEFRKLELELQLATDLYTSSLASLEQARVEAYRKLKHLVVVQAPKVPSEALYPRRMYNLMTILVVLLLTYGIIAMVIATIREHRDV